MDLTKWDNYNGLTKPKQEEDLYHLFIETMNYHQFHTYNKVKAYFKPGSDSMVDFYLKLERLTHWFDFSQAEQVKAELELYVEQLR